MTKHIRVLQIFICVLLISFSGHSQDHPSLILTKEGVQKIRAELGNVPLFDATLEKVKAEVDAEIA
ncbi:hypothetical protein, partial [Zobellia laminariae]